MTAASGDIREILRYVENQLQSNDRLRNELSIAVRRKDDSAMRKVASVLWKGVKWAAPIAFSTFLWILGIPIG
jgi:hypothetical protein